MATDVQLTPKERFQMGRDLRKTVPRSSHGEWAPSPSRIDPVELITAQNAARLQELVPYRHGRMAVSPFTFYRGAAKLMANDLSSTPVTRLQFQICGDAHLSNFGSFASPERLQLFDINDFDETLPGPWEWDVKRLAASVALAGRDSGFDDAEAHATAMGAVTAYRQTMIELSKMGNLEVWYSKASMDTFLAFIEDKKLRSRVVKGVAKFREKDSLQAHSKLTEVVDGHVRIKSAPPFLVPFRELPNRTDEMEETIKVSLAAYSRSLPDDRRLLLDSFRPVDVALKVVGVGSVGTRCYILLMEGRDSQDPLFLQVKEATQSVLEDHLPPTGYSNHGQRVVEGQRLMQAASDIFLGWSDADPDHDFYWRQFRDMKGSADLDGVTPDRLQVYARFCGRTLARAHARSGDPIAVAGYLGKEETFDRAVADFAMAYADQNQIDFEAFTEAIRSGQIQASEG